MSAVSERPPTAAWRAGGATGHAPATPGFPNQPASMPPNPYPPSPALLAAIAALAPLAAAQAGCTSATPACVTAFCSGKADALYVGRGGVWVRVFWGLGGPRLRSPPRTVLAFGLDPPPSIALGTRILGTTLVGRTFNVIMPGRLAFSALASPASCFRLSGNIGATEEGEGWAAEVWRSGK